MNISNYFEQSQQQLQTINRWRYHLPTAYQPWLLGCIPQLSAPITGSHAHTIGTGGGRGVGNHSTSAATTGISSTMMTNAPQGRAAVQQHQPQHYNQQPTLNPQMMVHIPTCGVPMYQQHFATTQTTGLHVCWNTMDGRQAASWNNWYKPDGSGTAGQCEGTTTTSTTTTANRYPRSPYKTTNKDDDTQTQFMYTQVYLSYMYYWYQLFWNQWFDYARRVQCYKNWMTTSAAVATAHPDAAQLAAAAEFEAGARSYKEVLYKAGFDAVPRIAPAWHDGSMVAAPGAFYNHHYTANAVGDYCLPTLLLPPTKAYLENDWEWMPDHTTITASKVHDESSSTHAQKQLTEKEGNGVEDFAETTTATEDDDYDDGGLDSDCDEAPTIVGPSPLCQTERGGNAFSGVRRTSSSCSRRNNTVFFAEEGNGSTAQRRASFQARSSLVKRRPSTAAAVSVVSDADGSENKFSSIEASAAKTFRSVSGRAGAAPARKPERGGPVMTAFDFCRYVLSTKNVSSQ